MHCWRNVAHFGIGVKIGLANILFMYNAHKCLLKLISVILNKMESFWKKHGRTQRDGLRTEFNIASNLTIAMPIFEFQTARNGTEIDRAFPHLSIIPSFQNAS